MLASHRKVVQRYRQARSYRNRIGENAAINGTVNNRESLYTLINDLPPLLVPTTMLDLLGKFVKVSR